MDRAELDAFFARCDDVLDDWQGSADSMNTGVLPTSFLRFLETIEAREPSELGTVHLASFFDDQDTPEPFRLWRRDLLMGVLINYPSRALIISSVA